jgi:DNA-directed RNA polymerase subunit RPC12/RpoP
MADIKNKPTEAVCRVCGSTIVERIVTGRPKHIKPILGGRPQTTTWSEGYHCSECGIKYRFLPKG